MSSTPDLRRGSIWRKWDLHIHSVASDGAATAKELIAISKAQGLSVVAVTDHHTAKLVDECKVEGLKEGITVIAGIEFRTEYGNKSVHMIGLFPDFHKNTKLDSKALHELVLSKLDLSETKIISKGKEKNPLANDDQAFKEGMFLVQVDFKKAADIIHSVGGLVMVHAGSKSNTVEQLKHQGQGKNNVTTLYDSLGVVKEELFKDRYIDICEIRKDQDSEEFYYTQFGKPSITASDAHAIDEIGSKAVWIKADPNFEGLKQITYEPKPGTRIYIGESAPNKKDKNRIIDQIQISNSNGWFEDITIPLNPDLVCIIGSRGSGKSALADLVGFAGGDIGNKIELEESFIGKAISSLKGTKVKLTWMGGNSTEIELLSSNANSGNKSVQYLSQGFVEKICSGDLDATELVSEIEKVIFDNLGETERRNFLSFSDYRQSKTSVLRSKRDAFHRQIESTNDEIYQVENLIAQLPKVRADKAKLNKERLGIEAQKQGISYSDEQERKLIEAIDKLATDREKKIESIANLKDKLQSVKDLQDTLEIQEINLRDYNNEILSKLKLLGIPDAEQQRFVFKNDPTAKVLLTALTDKTQKEILSAEGTATSPNTLAFIDAEIAKLRSASTLEKSKKDQLEGFQKRLKDISAETSKSEALEKEILEKQTQLPSLSQKRLEYYNAYVKVIDDEELILKELYSPIQAKLKASATSDEQLLSFGTIKDVNAKRLTDGILSTIDRRKNGKYFNVTDEAALHEITTVYNKIINSSTSESRNQLLNEYLKSFIDAGPINDQLKEGYSRLELYNEIFNTELYQLDYSISFGGVPLEALTPGTKGIALLILYLGINQNEYRPLIIDQPEENLDNRSVYKVLKEYFREAKSRRQIIMVTHNPNLVVNTDAEQVIVANFEKEAKTQKARVCYAMGSLENSRHRDDSQPILSCQGIREHTCEILEGGTTAFAERESKYGIR